MTNVDLANYRKALQALRQRLTGDVSLLAGEALGPKDGLNGNPAAAALHPAEAGSDNFEQEFTLSLMHNQEQVLEEITDALVRVERGTFGKCEECGSAIPKARLQTLPYARYCVPCARTMQKGSER
jgi:DnaK suppressor protein